MTITRNLSRPLTQSLTRTLTDPGAGGGGSYLQLMSPSQPLPAFVEGWATFNPFYTAAPTVSGIPTDSIGQINLGYTVSGASGASSLTISAGDESKGTGNWTGVLQHDDGTYGVYGITSLAAGVCTVFPNLRATVTAKTLRNMGGGVNGQHYTEPGYRALARHIFATTRGSAYRLRYAAKWNASTGVNADWTAVGGLGTQYAMTTANATIPAGVRAALAFLARGKVFIKTAQSASVAGKGLTKTFSLGGNTGFLEAFVSCGKYAAGGNFYPFNVTVVVDGVTLLNQNYTENDGLQRIIVPYTSGTSGTVTVTMTDATPATFYGPTIGDVTWWAYDRTPSGYAWTDSIIDKDAKTVIIGDSWTIYYPTGGSGVDGVLGEELQAAVTAAGGSGAVVSVGTAGTTAEFGLTEFDAKVAPESPAQVVICYFTNDHNSYGDAGYQRWLDAMYALGLKCQAIGARPIFIMPLPTSSYGQAIGHGIWAERIGAGLPI